MKKNSITVLGLTFDCWDVIQSALLGTAVSFFLVELDDLLLLLRCYGGHELSPYWILVILLSPIHFVVLPISALALTSLPISLKIFRDLLRQILPLLLLLFGLLLILVAVILVLSFRTDPVRGILFLFAAMVVIAFVMLWAFLPLPGISSNKKRQRPPTGNGRLPYRVTNSQTVVLIIGCIYLGYLVRATDIPELERLTVSPHQEFNACGSFVRSSPSR